MSVALSAVWQLACFTYRRASFFCSRKRKKPKKITPCYRLFLSVLAQRWGGCGTRAFSTQTVLAAYHLLAQASGAARVLKTIRNFTAVSLYLHRHSVLDTESSDLFVFDDAGFGLCEHPADCLLDPFHRNDGPSRVGNLLAHAFN